MNDDRKEYSEKVVFWCFMEMAAIEVIAITAEAVKLLLAA